LKPAGHLTHPENGVDAARGKNLRAGRSAGPRTGFARTGESLASGRLVQAAQHLQKGFARHLPGAREAVIEIADDVKDVRNRAGQGGGNEGVNKCCFQLKYLVLSLGGIWYGV
jgi:hypothetical protein